MASLLYGIYERHVPQSERKRICDCAAYWARSGEDSQTKDLAHWLGEGRWSDEIRWSQIGERHFSMYKMLCTLKGRRPVQTMVEWGPGGGANAVRFSIEVARIYGVDVSDANLRECERQLRKRGFSGFEPCLIPAEQPEKALEYISSPVDLFLSTAVYQHFPSKGYGVRVTEIASHLLVQDGLCIIQVRYDDKKNVFRTKVRNYFRNAISFTSYSIAEFWGVLCEAGLEPLCVSLEPRVNYAYFLAVKKSKTS
jgi:hypothetical protein